MERFWETVKKRPLLIGGSVLVLVLIIWWMSSGSDETPRPTVGYVGPNPATTAANTQLQIADRQANAQLKALELQLAASQGKDETEFKMLREQILAQTTIATSNNQAMLEAVKTNKATELSVAQLQAGLLSNQQNVLGQLQDKSIAAQLQIGLAQISGAVTQAQLNASVQQSQIAAGVTASKDKLTADMVNNNALYQQISAAYQTYLGRAPDVQGLQYWGEMVATGKVKSYEDIRWAIANSNEGKAVATKQANYNAAGLADFINSNQVYNDQMGFNTVDENVASHANDVYGSQETARNNAISQVYRDILGREADPAGIAYWSGTGLSIQDIGGYIKQSEEAKNGYRSQENIWYSGSA